MDQKTQYQAQLFANRLSKQYKLLKKWARKNRITCYRLYDRDIPEIPLALDLYTFLPQEVTTKMEAITYMNEASAAISRNDQQGREISAAELSRTWAHLYLYERPYEKDEKEEEQWLKEMAKAAADILNINEEHVLLKTRKKQSDSEGNRDQYEKLETSKTVKGTVLEQGQLFTVNLTDYIDTGLFFDHRPLRAEVRNTCRGKSVLNLFCYTGSFSVYAAEGKASRIDSVDMSKTYLDWAEKNFELNSFNPEESQYIFTRQDAVGFLNQKNAEVPNRENTNRWDIIILDPPTFSNSKRTDTTLDINRDWSDLVKKCLNLLNKKGILYFSTNSRRLAFDEKLLPQDNEGNPLYKAQDITASTIPEDYRNNKIHRAWKITAI